jgi:predicted transglutaminase-like cysteine proteinase
VHLSFKANLNIKKPLIFSAVIISFVFLSSFYLFAANYDFAKLSFNAKQRYGEEAHKSILELQQLVSDLQSAPELEKIQKINNFFNSKIIFADDISVWGQSDYWASPLEAIGRQAGDCEDYSIAKYMFLKAANVPNEKLRLTYVRAELNIQNHRSVIAHMVLSYYATPQSEPLILDSLKPDIFPASQRKDLVPIFSFNDKGIWVGSSNKPKGESQAHLSKWRDVLLRMQMDGLE